MKPIIILCFILLIVLSSCDGHIRRFSVPMATAPSGALQTEEKQKLIDALTEVASNRGFTRIHPELESDSYTEVVVFYKQIENGSVKIKLLQENKTGKCKFVILDWPSATRSDESVAVENAIRKKLEEK